MTKIRYKWSDESIATLRSEYPKVKSVEGLAARIGCTISAIYNKAHALGLQRGQSHDFRPFKLVKYTKEQFEMARKMYPDNSNLTISIVTGVSLGALKKWRNIHGWLKSDRYRAECKEFCAEKRKRRVARLRSTPEYREKQREWDRRYREKKQCTQIESQTK